MGLTITYTLQANVRLASDARHLLTELRNQALALPFKDVSQIIELTDRECRVRGRDDPNWGMLIHASRYLPAEKGSCEVFPRHVLAFGTCPGNGCDGAIFGLSRYPCQLEVTNRQNPQTRVIETGFTGWSWSGFCKTVYAAKREYGGPTNFLKCHMTVVQLLDQARALSIAADVCDPSGYWDDRRPESLLAAVGGWTPKLARFLALRRGESAEHLLRELIFYPALEGLGHGM